jgi:anti-anti-sigma factor
VDFRVALRFEDTDRVVAVIDGELDDAAGSHLLEVIAGVTAAVVVLDLERVTFMDSRGLGQLLAVVAAVEEGGAKAYVTNPSVHAERVLQTAGLTDRLREPGTS